MAKELQDNSSFLKANRKASLREAEPTVQHWKEIHLCPIQSYIAFSIVSCPVYKQNVPPAVW